MSGRTSDKELVDKLDDCENGVTRGVLKDCIVSRFREVLPRPIETAPKGIPVLIRGGLAMQKTGGEWFSGMEEPLYQRPLQWSPKSWLPMPELEE